MLEYIFYTLQFMEIEIIAVETEDGQEVCSFRTNEPGLKAFQTWAGALMNLPGASLYDEDKRQYIVGDAEQLARPPIGPPVA